MATTPNGPAPLTAADLAEFRANLETQRDLATAAIQAPVPATAVCQREHNRGLETAYNYALNALDELLADFTTFELADTQEEQGD